MTSSAPAVVVETVKLAADGSGDVVARLCEPHGGAVSARLTAAFEHSQALEVDLLERARSDGPGELLAEATSETSCSTAADGRRTYQLELGPFQVRTVRFVHAS